MSGRVAVVGGGISGLAGAWELIKIGRDLDVTLFEASDRVGGKLRLEQVGDVSVDVGAEAVISRRQEVSQLFDELALSDRITHPASVGASIVSGGTRWPLPTGTLMGVPSDPETLRGLLTDAEVERVAAEAPAGPVRGDISVGAFVDQRLGGAVTDKLVEPLLAGVYAGHARNISLAMAIPALAQAAATGAPLLETARAAVASPVTSAPDPAREPAPVFATLVGGLGGLPQVMAERLTELGVTIRTGTIVRGVERSGAGFVVSSGPTTDVSEESFDAVLLATPAAPTARLLRDLAPEASRQLATVEYASMAIVTIVLAGPAPEVLDSSGFLVPPTEPLTIKASTFSSVKWPWLAAAHPDRTVLRASIGRHREEATLHRSDPELVEIALTDLATVLGQRLPEALATHVKRWGGALPQYAVGHRDRITGLTEPAPGVALAGAAYDGVGVPACIGSGRAAAATLLTRLWAS